MRLITRIVMAGWLMFSVVFVEGRNMNYQSFGFQQVCDSPEVYVCDHFLSDAECDHIINLAHPHLARSTVVDVKGPNGLTDQSRTSRGMFISRYSKDKVVKRVCERIAHVTGVPQQNCEDIQVLHYDVGAEYRPHYDFFDPSTPGGLIHFKRGGQRVATLMVYLKTTPAGGETVFPKGNLKIAPVKGKAVFFFNVKPSGMTDPMSLHGGAPVVSGDKWIMTRWMREGVFN